MKTSTVVPNVTLGENLKEGNEYFPCPICFQMIEVRYARNSKPYCICNDCGMQLFIRGKNGIKRFKNLIPDSDFKFKSKKLIELIDYYEKLEDKLNQIEAKKPVFGEDRDLNIQERAVKKLLNSLRKKIE